MGPPTALRSRVVMMVIVYICVVQGLTASRAHTVTEAYADSTVEIAKIALDPSYVLILVFASWTPPTKVSFKPRNVNDLWTSFGLLNAILKYYFVCWFGHFKLLTR